MNYKLPFLLFLVLLLTACSDAQSKLKGEFLAGCISTGVNKSTCICTFDSIQEKHNFDNIKDFEKFVYLNPQKYLTEAKGAMIDCLED